MKKTIELLENQINNLTVANSGLEKAVFSFHFLQDFRSGLVQEQTPGLTKRTSRMTSSFTRPSRWYAHCPRYCSAIPYVPWTKDCCIHPVCHRRKKLKPHCAWFLKLQGNNQGEIMFAYSKFLLCKVWSALTCRNRSTMDLGTVQGLQPTQLLSQAQTVSCFCNRGSKILGNI